MKRSLLVAASLFSLVAAGLGCGAKHEGCAALARAACTRQIECSALLAKIYATNLDTCVQLVQQDCEQNTTVAGTTFDDSKAAACASAYPSTSCDDALTANLPVDCHPPGGLPSGANCGNDFQCQSNYCKTGSTRCGTCTPRPKHGEPCTELCDYGLQCSSGTCAPFRKAGEACDINFDCAPSLACQLGVCAKPQLGTACGAPYECSYIAAQYCDFATMTCSQRPFTIVKVGDACGAGADLVYNCPVGAFCKTPSNASFGICTALPKLGEPCGGSDGKSCTVPAVCSAGICQNFDVASCR